jgi:hypothetical protein
MSTIIPNELNITINTSIPGYQKIRYNPSMTIKEISKDDNTVRFNPLIKLNQKIIDKIPESYRIKEFFNRGLFQSMLNYINTTPAKGLNQATHEGYVDNNIKITLNTIFPENSVIYIGSKPYTIADVQWTKGDWKIDTKKKKEQIDSSKISDPYLYQTIVRDEIISGEKQLTTLNSDLVYGPNYEGPKDTTAKGVVLAPTGPAPPATITPATVTPSKPPIGPTGTMIIKPTPSKPSIGSTGTMIIKPTPSKPSIGSTGTIVIQPTPKQPTNYPALPPIPPEEPEILDEETNQPTKKDIIEFDYLVQPEKFIVAGDATNLIRDVFRAEKTKKISSTTKMYDLINTIFKISSDVVKEFINDILFKTTSAEIRTTDNLSKNAYSKSVDSMQIIHNSGGGNCFFIAVADAINYYNYYNQNSKITYGIFGRGDNSFTQMELRNIVFNFITSLPESEINDKIINIAPFNTENLNDIFSQSLHQLELHGEINNEKYIQIAQDIYKENDNFLVSNVYNVPIDIDEYYTPFKVIDKSQLKTYILSSDYWANDLAITALCALLKLNIIPISINMKKRNVNRNLKIIKEDTPQISIPYINDNTYKWNKYLFLYYHDSHYELITFNYVKTEFKYDKNGFQTSYEVKNKKAIFNKNIADDIPPIYIVFSIFGATYMSIEPESRNSFQLLNKIMRVIESGVYSIYQTNQYIFFYKYFKLYFPNSKLPTPTLQLENGPSTSNSVTKKNRNPNSHRVLRSATKKNIGGAYNNYRPYQTPRYYSQPPLVHKMIRKEENVDNVQLAYYITIDMELHPGTSLTPEEMKNYKCHQKWNSVRKAYADFTGKPYVIPPVYPTKTEKNNKPQQNYTRKNKK